MPSTPEKSLLTTAVTLERVAELLTASSERDLLAAVRLARSEVIRLLDEAYEGPEGGVDLRDA
jgi:hypothetical protein